MQTETETGIDPIGIVPLTLSRKVDGFDVEGIRQGLF